MNCLPEFLLMLNCCNQSSIPPFDGIKTFPRTSLPPEGVKPPMYTLITTGKTSDIGDAENTDLLFVLFLLFIPVGILLFHGSIDLRRNNSAFRSFRILPLLFVFLQESEFFLGEVVFDAVNSGHDWGVSKEADEAVPAQQHCHRGPDRAIGNRDPPLITDS